MNKTVQKIQDLIDDAEHIVILQSERVDGDSLGSSLALESILEEQGKEVTMASTTDVPEYLKFIDGWSRVTDELPNTFDMTILVDASNEALLGKVLEEHESKFAKKPFVVLDHHDVETEFNFDVVDINDETYAATGELIFEMAQILNWKVDESAAQHLLTSINFDSAGLTTEQTTSRTVRTVADLIDLGADLFKLTQQRRESNKRDQELFFYKSDLMKRVEFFDDGQIAFARIPLDEIKEYSPRFNPSILVAEEMRTVSDVRIWIVVKTYEEHMTGRIRANIPIANTVAEQFNGGGHPMAAGCRVTHTDFEAFKDNLINASTEAIKKYGENTDEAV